VLPQLRACLDTNGQTVAVSLIKGLDFDEEGPVLISDIIRKGLGDAASDVCVLMGANVADEMAQDEFCEATVGCHEQVAGDLVQRLFDCPSFRVDVTRDPLGVELCGALKNVVALGAGFCDGLSFGGNTKAAVIRHGLQEMREFCKLLDPENVQDNTFFESCGVADLITTCYGGRNRKCAEKFAQAEGKLSWDELEHQELGGQKLQGTHTAAKLYKVLKRRQLLAKFPLFHAVYEIAFKGKHPSTIVAGL
jgi:glycerol-3-phosphate dehydrogenase (NAD+)